MIEIKFSVLKVDRLDVKTFIRRESVKRVKTRREVFEFIDSAQSEYSKSYAKSISEGERIEVSIDQIIEPNYEPSSDPIRGGNRVKRVRKGVTVYILKAYIVSFCKRCGRRLTDPDSVARGIGPECVKKKPVKK